MVERVYLAGRMALGDRAPAQAEDIGLMAIFLFLVLALSLSQQARPNARARSSPLSQLDLNDPSSIPAKEHAMTQELTTEPRDHLVVCTDCGATLDRDYARPLLAMQQEGQVLDMRRRFICLDRVRCKERGPIAQSAEELRGDLEAAQTVIEELKAQLKQTKEELALARQALPTQEAMR